MLAYEWRVIHMKGKLAISVSKDTMIATASIIPDNDI